MQRLGREHKTRIVGIPHVLLAVVMIDPRGKPRSQPLDERKGLGLECVTTGFRGEGNVEYDNPPGKVTGLG